MKMCGILCEIYGASSCADKDEEVLHRIQNRGPNYIGSTKINLIQDNLNALFMSAILWMQGPLLTAQPAENDSGILLYNGDIFDETWDPEVSDTQVILDKLTSNSDSSQLPIIKALQSLKGPFSIIYYDKKTKDLYFTRDRIGRNTLLIHQNVGNLIISSVLGRKYRCVEIPATHIQILNLSTNIVKLYEWATLESVSQCPLQEWLINLQILQSQPDEQFNFDFDESENFIDEDGVLEYIESVSKEESCNLRFMNRLMTHPIISNVVARVTSLLEKSVKIRLEKQPQKCQQCLFTNCEDCRHCTIGVLFSGGLDCTILALLADKYLPSWQSIDLINVAFRKDDNATYDVPDRQTGRKSLQELKSLCIKRNWVFREINIPRDELERYQTSTIGDLVHPRQTILDESLGSALWFAARGKNHEGQSSCRVLLTGSGADELFGGYTRHRNAFKRMGWSGLRKELQLDWKRISFRNLARDNRVICDHGRQPRMPYLDEDFTDFVLQLKPWLKCFPSEKLGVGVGDKLLLRLVALKLGLTNVVTLPKRALQFGSRIANKKQKGSDISKTFLQN